MAYGSLDQTASSGRVSRGRTCRRRCPSRRVGKRFAMAGDELRRTRRHCRRPASLPEQGSDVDCGRAAGRGHGDNFGPVGAGAFPRWKGHAARPGRLSCGCRHLVGPRRGRRSGICGRNWWFDASVSPMESCGLLAVVPRAGFGRGVRFPVPGGDQMTGLVPRRAPGLTPGQRSLAVGPSGPRGAPQPAPSPVTSPAIPSAHPCHGPRL